MQAINLGGSLSLTEIARTVGLPYGTASRLVMTLVHEGMIEKEPDRKKYRPTLLVQSLSSGYQDFSRLVALARRPIVTLTERHGCPVALSTRLGLNMIVRDCTHTLSHFTLSNYYPGFIYPMIHSAAGLVQLAFSNEHERDQSRLALEQSPGVNSSDLSSISEPALAAIRQRGFAIRSRNRFTTPEGKNSAIAAPILHNGQLTGTVALIFLASTVRMDKAVELYAQDTMGTAREIGHELDANEPVAPLLSA